MNNDNSDSTIFIIIFTVIAFVLLKEFFYETFVMIWKVPVLCFLIPLIYLPTMITENVLFMWVNNIPERASVFSKILLNDSSYIKDKYMDTTLISDVNAFVSSLIAPYVLIVLTFYIYNLYKSRMIDKYKKTFSMNTLIEDQADLWPQIKPMVGVHPEKIEDLDTGVWAMGLEPKKFAEINGLVEYSENRMGEEEIRLNESKALEVFQEQLERPWQSVESLTQVEKFMLSILLLKANRLGAESLAHAAIISQRYTTEKKYSKKELAAFKEEAELKTEEIIEKYKSSEPLNIATSEHFFILTVFPRMLELARIDGVLATGDFIWLKIENRRLWYILNNVGRKAAWAECAGIWHHYNYEKAIRRKIPSPMISGAVASLDWEFINSSESYIKLDGYNEDF